MFCVALRRRCAALRRNDLTYIEAIFSTCAKLVTTRGIEASSHAMRKIYDFSGYVNNLYR